MSLEHLTTIGNEEISYLRVSFMNQLGEVISLINEPEIMGWWGGGGGGEGKFRLVIMKCNNYLLI